MPEAVRRLLPSRLAVDPLLLVPCLLGYGVRLWAARGPDLGLDGGLSVALARLPLSEALGFLAHDVHPPLSYLLLRPWLAVAGTSPLAVKYLGVAWGTLALAVLVAWVRSLAGREAALAAGVIGAVAPAWVVEDVTVREYGLALLLLTALAWAHSRGSPRARRAFVVLGIAAVWTSYLAVVVPAVVGVGALVRRDWRRLVQVGAIGLSLAPWLGFAFSQGFAATLRSSGPRQGPASADPLPIQVRDLVDFLTGGPALTPTWLGPICLVAVILLLVLVGIRARGAPGQIPPPRPWASLIGATVAGIILALVVNIFWTRQGLGIRFADLLLPFVFAGLGMGVALPREGAWLRAALVIALVGIPGALGIRAWDQRPPPPPAFWDPDSLVRYLDARVRPGDAVVFVWPEQAGYYQVLSAHPNPWILVPAGIDYLQGDAAARARVVLPPVAARSRVVWLVLYRQVLGTGTSQVGDWLSFNAAAATAATLPDSDVVPYVATPPPAPPDPVDAHFRGGIRLLSAAWPAVIWPSAALPVDLRWVGDGEPQRNLRVFVHLVDSAGRIIAQHDGVPSNARSPVPDWVRGRVVDDRHGLLVPPNLAPGTYWLEVGLYDDNGRLPLTAGGDTLRFGPVTAVPAAPSSLSPIPSGTSR